MSERDEVKRLARVIGECRHNAKAEEIAEALVRAGVTLEIGDGSSHFSFDLLRLATTDLYDTLEREFDAARAEAARMREALEKAAPLLNVAASYRGTPPDMAANLWRAEKSARRALAQGGQG